MTTIMTDSELADKIVALGVGEVKLECYWMAHGGYKAEQFVRDWRVAGALMEKCYMVEVEAFRRWSVMVERPGKPQAYFKARNESLPRAINEACAEALSNL